MILRGLLRAIVALIVIIVAGQGAKAVESQPRLQKILGDWQRRQQWFQTVKYEVSGEQRVPKGAYSHLAVLSGQSAPSKPDPSQDLAAPVGITILLDLTKGRYRRHTQEQFYSHEKGKLVCIKKIDAFNGTVVKSFLPREENVGDNGLGIAEPDVSILSGNMRNAAFLSAFYPIFFAQGRVYTAMEPILPGKIRNRPDPSYLFVHGEGMDEGRPSLIVRTQVLQMATTSFDEYWIDPGRDSAIVRYLSYSGKHATQEIRIHYALRHEHWLPESWRWTVWNLGKTLYEQHMRVDRIISDPAVTDADFELEVKAGRLIQEITDLPTSNPIATPKSKVSVYRTGPNERKQVADPYNRQGDGFKPSRNVLIWPVIILLSVPIGFLVWRRFRDRKR